MYYGPISSYTEWNFTDTTPVIGLYGRQDAGRIVQLGFIMIDTTGDACVAVVGDFNENDTIDSEIG